MNSASSAPAPTSSHARDSLQHHTGTSNALMIGALGVVFGDIGTSPLYTLNTLFTSSGSVELNPQNILGVLSLIFWSLTLIITVKYVGYVMRADNKGEGGILALSTLLVSASRNWRLWSPIAALGVFGAAFFLGDGFITPAQSIMGAIEGVIIMSPTFTHAVVPGTVLALTVLFMVQKHGTGAVSKFFGPVMLVWFASIALLGTLAIIKAPQILAAVNPYYAIHFFVLNGWVGFVTLSYVFLAITGGEALYADMGHFGRPPIRNAWLLIAMPALVLNYFGQGALLLVNPKAIANPFYLLAPSWILPLLIMLAIAAAIIASQALISGVFSVARQAINLGYLPRLKVVHSSEDEIGQVYLPSMNWLLFAGTVLLTISFGSAEALANAYGIAVSTNMVMVSIMLTLLLPSLQWPRKRLTSALLIFIAAIELAFFLANMTKFFSGGWFPLAIGIGAYLLMSTWHEGRKNLNWLLTTQQISTRDFLAQIEANPPRRVAGTAVYLVSEASGVPRALTQNLRLNGVLHERNLLFTFSSAEVPSVPEDERVTVQLLAPGLFRVIVRFGFMETPNIIIALRAAEEKGLEFKPEETMYVVGRENPVITTGGGMPIWRKRLFAIMGRNAQLAAVHFGIPAHRVVEIGSQIRL